MVRIDGVAVPDGKMASEATELVRDTASPLLFDHSSRVYYFGALAGQRRGLPVDAELPYVGAMFRDLGLTARHSSKTDRFEVDGANAARDFLRQHGIDQQDIDTVWTAIAIHTTPGIPQFMHPVIGRRSGRQGFTLPSHRRLLADPSLALEGPRQTFQDGRVEP